MLRTITNIIASLAFVGAASAADITLLNVSYDPTRELYDHLSKAFARSRALPPREYRMLAGGNAFPSPGFQID